MASAFAVFVFFVAAVTVLGFLAARWGSRNLHALEEWALAGRGFGTIVSWFLLGGDLYTAYTFIAVPALVYGAGAIGFFAVPYTTIAYPFVFLVMTRFWSVASRRGYVTLADFVRDRYGDRWLEIAVAVTGFLGAMPYIALQLTGMQVIFVQFGARTPLAQDLALFVAFALLAAYTYTSGLRAPALIAFVKDVLIYATIAAAMAIIPARLGGWAHVFSASAAALAAHTPPGGLLLPHGLYFAYASLAFGSSLSLFLYPHSITSLLSARSKLVIQRNAALLPLYSILLALLALLGFCALAAGVDVGKNASLAVPLLLRAMFPGWLLGVAYSAIVIGALVPAAIMAIGSANLFASNVLREFHRERPSGETRQAKVLCIGVLVVGLLLVFFMPVPYAINFQLLGGAWMLQVVPAAAIGLFTRWFEPRALLVGWAAGMVAATLMGIASGFKTTFALGGLVGYLGLYALALNLAVAMILTFLFNALRIARLDDATAAADYA